MAQAQETAGRERPRAGATAALARRRRGLGAGARGSAAALAAALALIFAFGASGAQAQGGVPGAPTDPATRAAADLARLADSTPFWLGLVLGVGCGGGAAFVAAARRNSARAAGERAIRRPSSDARGAARMGEPGALDDRAPDDRALEDRAREADRLFRYFERRFALQGGAKEVIAYLGRVADAVGRLRERAEAAEERAAAAETRAAALDEALRRGGPDRGGGEANPLGQAEAAWRLTLDGVRAARAAAHELRRDPDFRAFAGALALDETLRRVAAARIGLADRDPMIEPDAIEEGWPSALWRLDALLCAYYPAHGSWRGLRDGVGAAAAGLRRLFQLAELSPAYAPLLAPRPPRDAEAWSADPGALVDLEPARSVILARAAAGEDGFVIDCESFGFDDPASGLAVRSRLVVFDADLWEAAEAGRERDPFGDVFEA